MNKKAELLIEYVKCAPPGHIVEVGSIRHEIEDEDGWSTKYLAQYCQQNNLDRLDVEFAHLKFGAIQTYMLASRIAASRWSASRAASRKSDSSSFLSPCCGLP